MMTRLCTYPDMARVWKTLETAPLKPSADRQEALARFFRHASIPPDDLIPLDALQGLRPSEKKKPYRQLANLAKKFRLLLEKGVGEGVISATRASPAHFVSVFGSDEILELLRFDEQEGHQDLLRCLRVLEHAALMACENPAPLIARDDFLPTRLRAKDASRSAYIRLLKQTIGGFYIRPLHELVATTVNVALDLPDAEVTADTIRKA